VTGWNSKIDFNRGGVKVATVAAGTYVTGASLATAIITALEAADATPVWNCTYSTSTHKFTISSDLSFVLLASTGTNKALAILRDLGYSVAADTSSATSHVAAVASYQSRHALLFDMGSAQAITSAILLDHNVSSARVDGNASALATAGATGTLTQELAGDTAILVATFGSVSFRYWRFLLDAVEVSDGFTEVSVPFLGTATAIDCGILLRNNSRGWRDFSGLQRARQGAAFSQPLQMSRVWNVQYLVVSQAELDSLEVAFSTTRRGVPFFWMPKSSVPGETYYAFTEADLSARSNETESPTWDLSLQLEEMPE
jgi:hypothetical protein